MHNIKITFLGTGTSMGVPMIGCRCGVCTSKNTKDKRLRCSILLQSASTTVIIDTGTDFRQQMLAQNVQQLDAVVYTHAHKDHTGGLDDVRAFNLWQQKSMPLYADTLTESILKRHFDYAFFSDYPGAPQLKIQSINKNTPFIIGDIPFIPIEVTHGNSLVLGFRIHDFTYITDASYIAPKELAKIKGSNSMVLNAIRKSPEHWSHFTLGQAVALINNLHIPRAYLTHISHQMGLHAQVNKELPKHIGLAYDGLTFFI